MTPFQPILESARQGDPAAISALINQSLEAKGVVARVTRKETCLRVLLEANQIPDQQALVLFLQERLAQLNMVSINSVELQGKQTYAAAPAWRQSFNLIPPAPPVSEVSQIQPVEADISIASSPEVSLPLPLEAVATPEVTAPKTKPQKTYQVLFSAVMALILMLIGANLRSVQTLFTQSSPHKNVSLSDGLEVTYQAPIISRVGGVPVIMVTFNESHPFPMVVDTGAGGTLITQSMAAALNVEVVGQVMAETANGSNTFDMGYVNSIEVDGAKVSHVSVVIGLPDLTLGLLGHDFFNNFDVSIREQVVEFRPRK
ncbi:retropepsin-like aspartic protease family protein [Neosynechococcus sphagnicola]|uniref:retropepsin-like aspartic protease family protein n=1 Tax=Neosynechococcus sphagnicola TaxID=1501145 RepID=UPI00068D8493|nr:retropepsin-like aspartic protease [Neosynechococcus sphagnicola]